MNDSELLGLHREIVAIPSISGQEGPLCDHLETWFRARGVDVERMGNNLYATCGCGPTLCLNTHMDTIPPSPGWTRPPWEPTRVEGMVYGLGSNDAKASVAAMIAAFLRIRDRDGRPSIRILLTLVCEEETGGGGTETLLPELRRRGFSPEAAIIGEPTGLDLAVAQKGLLVLELHAQGRACHAAHGRALGTSNPLRALARDLISLDSVDFGLPHPLLGPVTLEPTMMAAGTARNMIPAEAKCVLDVRTNPGPDHEETMALLQGAVAGELRVLSRRLRPCSIDPEQRIVRAARRARPEARQVGSRGISDLVHFNGVPAIKAGPGVTERSHTPDEYVLESEILAGACFYEETALAYDALRREEENGGTLVGPW